MMKKLTMIAITMFLAMNAANGAVNYTYDGSQAIYGATNNFDSLDGTWDHNNGSDAWDGTGPGSGNPGGIAALTEGADAFLRIQDTGNPARYGFTGDTNRKLGFVHMLDDGTNGNLMDAGVTLSFRMRIATTGVLDDTCPDVSGGTRAAWPTNGKGYGLYDDGKAPVTLGFRTTGNLAYRLGFSIIHSSEVAGVAGYENVPQDSDILVMNNLAGNTGSTRVDTFDNDASITRRNYIPLANGTTWNDFVVAIAPGGTGTHQLTITSNGVSAGVFDVTAGYSNDGVGYPLANYLMIGTTATGAWGAVDLDYISIPEPMTLVLLGLGALTLRRRK